jgi:hypothetical protein
MLSQPEVGQILSGRFDHCWFQEDLWSGEPAGTIDKWSLVSGGDRQRT